jgi:hypothetical protein
VLIQPFPGDFKPPPPAEGAERTNDHPIPPIPPLPPPPEPEAPPPLRIERVITRDAVPFFADDLDMANGWRFIPIPPTDDPDWFIVDISRDRKTVWARIRAGAEG